MQITQRQDDNHIPHDWQKVLEAFRQHYGEDIFKSDLEMCRFGLFEKTIAVINAPTLFQKQRIENDYKLTLKEFWKDVNPDIMRVEILIGRRTLTQDIFKPQETEIIKLPLWAEAVRCTPNAILRGALFAAITPNKRKALYRDIIADEKNLKIKFTGWQLDQSDRDVWEQALHMARQEPLGKDIYFTAHSFLKALGRSTGKSQHEWLNGSLSRLLGCGVEIRYDNHTYGGSLLEFEREEDTQHYKLSINPKMKALYTAGWTQIDYEERIRIGNKKYLALWLHGYIASHAELYPTKVETFYRLSGSTNSCMRDFKRSLKNALTHLKEIDLIKDFHFEDNLVHIEKYPSDSQKRHLNKHKNNKRKK